MTTLQIDICDEFFLAKGKEITRNGQDVTALFTSDDCAPAKATVVELEGPGGGNPLVELRFRTEAQAREWHLQNYDDDEETYLMSAVG